MCMESNHMEDVMTTKHTAYQIVEKNAPYEPLLYIARVPEAQDRTDGFVWFAGSACGFCENSKYGVLPLHPGAKFWHKGFKADVEIVKVNPKTVTVKVIDRATGTGHNEKWEV